MDASGQTVRVDTALPVRLITPRSWPRSDCQSDNQGFDLEGERRQPAFVSTRVKRGIYINSAMFGAQLYQQPCVWRAVPVSRGNRLS